MANQSYLLLFYKGDISALTLFCQWPDGSLCYPALPKLTSVLDETELQLGTHELIPKQLLNDVNQRLQLANDILVIEPSYFQQVEQADGIKTVYMARFNLLDPPHQLLAPHQCKLQPLTNLIGSSPTEMELIRRAYTLMMEG